MNNTTLDQVRSKWNVLS